MRHPTSIILFDGVCNLCSASVDFVIERDPGGRFRMAALQSNAGRRVLREAGWGEEALESLVLVEDGRVYHRSTAALRIARGLRGAWKALYLLVVIPRPIRDGIYDWIARRRYRWFGRRETCRMATPELMGRFVV